VLGNPLWDLNFPIASQLKVDQKKENPSFKTEGSKASEHPSFRFLLEKGGSKTGDRKKKLKEKVVQLKMGNKHFMVPYATP